MKVGDIKLFLCICCWVFAFPNISLAAYEGPSPRPFQTMKDHTGSREPGSPYKNHGSPTAATKPTQNPTQSSGATQKPAVDTSSKSPSSPGK